MYLCICIYLSSIGLPEILLFLYCYKQKYNIMLNFTSTWSQDDRIFKAEGGMLWTTGSEVGDRWGKGRKMESSFQIYIDQTEPLFQSINEVFTKVASTLSKCSMTLDYFLKYGHPTLSPLPQHSLDRDDALIRKNYVLTDDPIKLQHKSVFWKLLPSVGIFQCWGFWSGRGNACQRGHYTKRLL